MTIQRGFGIKLLVGLLSTVLLAGCGVVPAASPPATQTPSAAAPSTTPAPKPAENFPTKPITWIIPYAPGGGVEAIVRGMAPYLTKELGVDIVVKAVPGAGSKTGYVEFVRSEPDGYTLFNVASGFPTVGYYFGDLEGVPDPATVEWLGMVFNSPVSLWTGGTGAIKTWEDLKTLGRPVKVADTSLASTSIPVVLGLLHYLDIPYVLATGFGGQAEVNPALMRNEADLLGRSVASQIHLLGDLRPVVLASKHPKLPEVATLDDIAKAVGNPKIAELNKVGMLGHLAAAPPGTPPERVKILSDAIQKVLVNPDFVKWAADANQDIVSGVTGDQVKANNRDAIATLKELDVKALTEVK